MCVVRLCVFTQLVVALCLCVYVRLAYVPVILLLGKCIDFLLASLGWLCVCTCLFVWVCVPSCVLLLVRLFVCSGVCPYERLCLYGNLLACVFLSLYV